MDRPALRLNRTPRDREPKPGSLLARGSPTERLEDRAQFLPRQAVAGIADGNRPRRLGIIYADLDRAGIGILHGIVGQVLDRRSGEIWIEPDPALTIAPDLERQPLLSCHGAGCLRRAVKDLSFTCDDELGFDVARRQALRVQYTV